MEKSLLIRNALVALLVIVGIGSSRADSDFNGAQNCQDRLDNNLYRCRGNNTIVGEAEVCLQFKSPGMMLSSRMTSQFDLDEQLNFLGPDVMTISYGCVCSPVGVRSPEFNASKKKFLCANAPFDGALAGEVSKNGERIVYRAWNNTGDSAVYQCTRDPTCTVP
ncbi:MAG: hypothetical protein ACREYE_31675 [Gammaproteobacteria bacterium]